MLRDLYQEVEYDLALGRDIPEDVQEKIREKLGKSLRLHHKRGHGLLLPTTHHGLVTVSVEWVLQLAEAAGLKAQVFAIHADGHSEELLGRMQALDHLPAHAGDIEFFFS